MKKLTSGIAFLLIAISAFAQKPIFYEISFPNAAHHEAEIRMTISEASSAPIRVRMSRSSAGRYATHEFGKNIYNVKAYGADSSKLDIKQIEGDVYEIRNHEAVVKISYTLYANYVDGTYSGIDESHAHLNMPATFMWALGMENRGIKVMFSDIANHNWKVATQLKHDGATVYSATNLQYLMDSPTELSNYKESSWNVVNTDGKTEKIILTTHSDDAQSVIDNYAKLVQKMVLEEKAVFGELPTYDYGEYTFLQDVYPSNSGDGMEHRNSTCIVTTGAKVEGNETRLLSTFAHEYFHSWNVKRIRPKSLEPFNFEHADMSGELWFAEGFTQYYGELVLVRAGFHTPADYTRTMSGLINSVLNSPGAAKYSPIQMSNYSVFADAGVSIDPTNQANIFTSYYYYGGATALALDLRLRAEYNLTLDDYMRQVWLDWGKPYTPYTVADLEKSLAKVTKSKVFAYEFFKKYIYGVEKNDYKGLLAKAGFILRKSQEGKAYLGLRTDVANGKLVILSNTLIGSAGYKAGLDKGDVLLKADGAPLTDASSLNTLVAGKKPGDKITITYHNRSGDHDGVVVLDENPFLEVVSAETLTPEQQTFRNNWLSSKVK